MIRVRDLKKVYKTRFGENLVFEDISFEAEDHGGETITIDATYVEARRASDGREVVTVHLLDHAHSAGRRFELAMPGG